MSASASQTHSPELLLRELRAIARTRRVSLQSVLRTCFNWVIAEYTPAPFPNQPQNEVEQLLIIVTQLEFGPWGLGVSVDRSGGFGEENVRGHMWHTGPKARSVNSSRGRPSARCSKVIILTCLPLLGAQIGKIGGTLSPCLNCGELVLGASHVLRTRAAE